MQTHWVEPELRDRPPMKLSAWDETLVGLHSGKTWFFPEALDAEQVVAGLHSALRTLPSLAGRLETAGPARHEVRFERGMGARIDIVDAPRSAGPWPASGMARRSVKGLMPATFLRPVDRDVPLLWATLTRFADGRSALGVVYSHALLDGGGSARLAEAWAAGCAGQSQPEAADPRAELDSLADELEGAAAPSSIATRAGRCASGS